jgi:hypothetical protein
VVSEPRTKLPPCFQPKVYVCPRPECHYIGSADEKWGWKDGAVCFGCGHQVDEKDVHVFGPESPASSLTQPQLSDEDRERLRLIAFDLEGEEGRVEETPAERAAFLRKLASQPQQQPEEDADDLCTCGHERFHHEDGRETGVYTNCKAAGCKCPAFRQQHGEVEEDAKPKGWSLIHEAHAARAEVVISARRTWIADGIYNEEGGEYRGHVVSITDDYLDLFKDDRLNARIEWPDVLDVSLWSDFQHRVPTKGEERR